MAKKGFTEFTMTEKMKKIFAVVYYIYFSVLLIRSILVTTMIDYHKFSMILDYCVMFFAMLVLTKVALEWKEYWSGGEIIIAIITVGLLICSCMHFNKVNTVEMCIAIIGVKNLDIKKVLKVFCAIVLSITIVTVILALTKKIPNIITYRDAESDKKRMALGFSYATWLAAYLMSISAVWFYIRRERIKWFEVAIIGAFAVLGYVLTDARIASFATAIICLIAVCTKITVIKKYFDRVMQIKAIIWLCTLATVLLSVIAVVLAIEYKFDSDVWGKINRILSTRPYSNAIAFRRHQVTAWGQMVIENANFSNGMRGIADNYFAMNCSYIRILFFYGIFGFFAIVFAWCLITKREADNKNFSCMFMFAVLALYFFFEQRMFEFSINPFWLLLIPNKENGVVKNSFNKVKVVGTTIVVAFLIEIFVFNMDSFRTLLNQKVAIDDCVVVKNELEYNDDVSMFEPNGDNTNITLLSYETQYMESLCPRFNLYSEGGIEDYKFLGNESYTVDVIFLLNDEVVTYTTHTVKMNDPSTAYIGIDEKELPLYVKYIFHFPDNCRVKPVELSFNVPKPFSISYIRLLIITLVLIGAYGAIDLLLKKKNSASNI